MFIPTPEASSLSTADFIRPQTDTWEYRSLRLTNGLPVLLISDRQAERAAATLDLNVGSGSDPLEAQGLAHYLEHMLFLGTESYPEIDGFQHFIAQSGGSYNASTSYENTNYFFETAPESFAAAIDRFAEFFYSPIFPEEYSTRERNVIEAEYSGGQSSDGRRYWALLKELVNPEHPMAKFNVGNQQTLAGAGKRLQQLLRGFFQEHYHSGRMRLVLYAPGSLDELEQLARARFSAIAPAPEAQLEAAAPALFVAGQLPMQVRYKPLREIYSLSLNFPLASQQPHWRSKSVALLSHLVGHEARGSLAYVLKQRQLINQLSSGLSFSNSDSALFSVNIDLSVQGREQIDQITELFFAWVRLIGSEADFSGHYRELQQIQQQQFDFQQLGSASSVTRDLARDWHLVPDAFLLAADHLLLEYDPEQIQQSLAALRPENLVQIVGDPQAATDQVEPYYQVHYQRSRWQPAGVNVSSEALSLPQPNKFISTDLSIFDLDGTAHPELVTDCALEQQPCLEAWYRFDSSYGLPHANYFFNLRSPLMQQSAYHRFAVDLWLELVRERVEPELYDAQLAGYEYRLYPTTRGVSARLNGFPEHLDLVLSALSAGLQAEDFDADTFDRLRADRLLELRNAEQNAPLDLALEALQKNLIPALYTNAELAAAGADLTLAELLEVRAQFLARGSLLSLAHGNISAEQSDQLNAILQREFNRPALAVEQVHPRIISSAEAQRVTSLDNDYAAVVYLQGPDASLLAQAHSLLISALLKGRFFQQLRTEEELGYSVAVYDFQLFDHPGLAFVVQSNSRDGDYLRARSLRFIAESEAYLAGLDAEDLLPYQQGLAANLTRKAENLDRLSQRYWQELDKAEPNFRQRELLAATVLAVEAESLLDYWRQISQQSLSVSTEPTP